MGDEILCGDVTPHGDWTVCGDGILSDPAPCWDRRVGILTGDTEECLLKGTVPDGCTKFTTSFSSLALGDVARVLTADRKMGQVKIMTSF